MNTVGKKIFTKENDWEKVSLFALIAIGAIFFFVLLSSIRFANDSAMNKIYSYSNLIDTKEISTLSVSKFVYNGIAQSLKDSGEIDYNVLYKSTVKVGIDANSIRYTVDEKQKTITIEISEFRIDDPVIDVGSVSLIPNRKDLFMDDVITLCRKDALAEAQKSDKLITSAQENLTSIIEAWYSPVFSGYSFECEFDAAEDGEAQ